ncbi:MAG: LacI family DNA-binding transcriptional regulator [Pseudomonadota bacterium]
MTTLSDVAREAGLSTAAVSRYLNSKLDLPNETKARVDAAIAKLDYRPNQMARRLTMGRTEAIALLVPEITNPFFAALAAAIETEARSHGYSVYLSSSGGSLDREIESLQRLSERHMDGLILCTNRPDDGSLAAQLERHRNVVLADEDVAGPQLGRVFVDNRLGAKLATRHLIGFGHRDIAIIAGPKTLFSGRERLAGFREAMAKANVPVDKRRVFQGSYSMDYGRQVARSLLAGPARPTAIFACSDFVATGVLEVARALSISVPDELSIIGFDDMPFASMLSPGLTTVHQPVDDLGKHAVRALLSTFDDPSPPETRGLPVKLVVRDSVAAPRTSKERR